MRLDQCDDWKFFRYNIKNNHRYIFSSPAIRGIQISREVDFSIRFLNALIDSVARRKRFINVEKGKTLWRAQRDGTVFVPPPITWIAEDGSSAILKNPGPTTPGGTAYSFECRAVLRPHDCKRMIPFSDKAKEGRLNPKGIPCLYTATEPRTAMSEVKPALGSYLTLAEFVIDRELRIVDFASSPIEIADPDGNLTAEEEDALVWEDLNDSFSEPVTDSDNVADYAPTQIVSELFKQAGFDGIRFKSKCSEFRSLQPVGSSERLKEVQAATREVGINIALFDLATASFKASQLYRLETVESGHFDFVRVTTEVFCSDQIPYQVSEEW